MVYHVGSICGLVDTVVEKVFFPKIDFKRPLGFAPIFGSKLQNIILQESIFYFIELVLNKTCRNNPKKVYLQKGYVK